MTAPRLFDEVDVRGDLRRACAAAGGQSAFARANGVSAQYVGDVLAGKRRPGPGICAALGYVRLVRFHKSTIPKSGNRFSDKIARPQKAADPFERRRGGI